VQKQPTQQAKSVWRHNKICVELETGGGKLLYSCCIKRNHKLPHQKLRIHSSNLKDLNSCFLWCLLMCFAQSTPQFIGKLVIAFLAHWLQITLIELGLLVHLLVTHRTGKMVHAPCLVQSSENCEHTMYGFVKF
jgi:hypothetical protein